MRFLPEKNLVYGEFSTLAGWSQKKTDILEVCVCVSDNSNCHTRDVLLVSYQIINVINNTRSYLD